MKSSCLISLLALISVSISYNVYAQERLYKLIKERDVPGIEQMLNNIRRREKFGWLGAALFDSGAIRASKLGAGGVIGGFASGHAVNSIRPIPQPVRPNPISANSSISATLAGESTS